MAGARMVRYAFSCMTLSFTYFTPVYLDAIRIDNLARIGRSRARDLIYAGPPLSQPAHALLR